ncbi:MAG: DNA primase DnaG [Candidatus Micrarchaeota archaeon]
MGKTYIDTVKYLVKANFDIGGIVEKPDVVGAIFGQTEGLLGDELDLRELQKNGRIGRIEVNITIKGGRSIGSILIPSSLDMVETSLLAASLEIVDRVGPCEARISVDKIEDTRNLKRKMLLDRAKNLLRTVIVDEIPESKELADMVRDELKTTEVQSFGEDKLPCGPEVFKSESIVIVEGRADVINMLKNGIKNCVAIGGANVGKTIIELAKQKDATVFLDGDRGGDIILRELLAATELDWVARAPAGKEVEELARKELIMALRRKIPAEQAAAELKDQINEREARYDRSARFDRSRRPESRDSRDNRAGEARLVKPAVPGDSDGQQYAPREPVAEPQPARPVVPELSPADAAKAEALKAQLKELEGTLKARFVGADLAPIAEVPIREIMTTLTDAAGVHAIILDGIVTQRLVDLAEQKKVEFAVGLRAGNLERIPASLKIVLAEKG